MHYRSRISGFAVCVSLACGFGGTAIAQPLSACRGEPARSAIIGGVAGSALVVGMALLASRDHHVSPEERLPYIWGATWGAVIGSTSGHLSAARRCPEVRSAKPVLPTTAHDCRRRTWSGAAKGGIGGALGGFLAAPFLVLGPAAIAGASGRHIDFERAVYAVTGLSAAAGAPVGAYRAHSLCAQ
jgi:hypothetical protein